MTNHQSSTVLYYCAYYVLTLYIIFFKNTPTCHIGFEYNKTTPTLTLLVHVWLKHFFPWLLIALSSSCEAAAAASIVLFYNSNVLLLSRLKPGSSRCQE